MNYQWILFDADDTLFAFDSFLGLSNIFKEEGLSFTQQDYAEFQHNNRLLWQAYQNGTISAAELAESRFTKLANKTRFHPSDLNHELQLRMAKLSPPMPGVPQLLAALYGKVKLGLISNGFSAIQQPRLDYTGLSHYFDVKIISEEVGFAKPDVRIFEIALTQMNQPEPRSVLMVGDSLSSDIIGGQNAGMTTCWVNWHNAKITNGASPDFIVDNIINILDLIG